ncbi:MAG: STAUR_1299 family protein [Archangium sp.]|nr:STAUR_1299 family protein [Archangium sp.]
MTGVLEQLQQLAFHRASPAEANTAIDETRAQRSADSGSEAVSYEVALPALGPDEFLTTRVLPKLVYFLDCRGVKVPGSGGVFVSMFTTDGLLFVEGGPMVEVLARARSLTLAEVVRRYGADGKGDPPLLGG